MRSPGPPVGTKPLLTWRRCLHALVEAPLLILVELMQAKQVTFLEQVRIDGVALAVTHKLFPSINDATELYKQGQTMPNALAGPPGDWQPIKNA